MDDPTPGPCPSGTSASGRPDAEVPAHGGAEKKGGRASPVPWSVAGAILAFLAVLGLAGSRPVVPDRVWLGYDVTSDAEDALPGVYLAPNGERLEGYDADGTEQTLAMSRTGGPTILDRLARLVGVRRAPMEYVATGDHADDDSSRWVEYRRSPSNE